MAVAPLSRHGFIAVHRRAGKHDTCSAENSAHRTGRTTQSLKPSGRICRPWTTRSMGGGIPVVGSGHGLGVKAGQRKERHDRRQPAKADLRRNPQYPDRVFPRDRHGTEIQYRRTGCFRLWGTLDEEGGDAAKGVKTGVSVPIRCLSMGVGTWGLGKLKILLCCHCEKRDFGAKPTSRIALFDRRNGDVPPCRLGKSHPAATPSPPPEGLNGITAQPLCLDKVPGFSHLRRKTQQSFTFLSSPAQKAAPPVLRLAHRKNSPRQLNSRPTKSSRDHARRVHMDTALASAFLLSRLANFITLNCRF